MTIKNEELLTQIRIQITAYQMNISSDKKAHRYNINERAEALVANNPDLRISSKSVCTSGIPESPHILEIIDSYRKDAYVLFELVLDTSQQYLNLINQLGCLPSPINNFKILFRALQTFAKNWLAYESKFLLINYLE